MRPVTSGSSNSIWYNPNQPNGGGCVILPGKPRPGEVTLSKKDRANAKELHPALFRAKPQGGEAVTLKAKDGVVRGPEGQPLVRVSLGANKTAYVDPNTNQYYLAGRQPVFRLIPGAPMPIFTKGPFDLPAKAKFSDAQFCVADVQALTKLAAPRFEPLPGKDIFR